MEASLSKTCLNFDLREKKRDLIIPYSVFRWCSARHECPLIARYAFFARDSAYALEPWLHTPIPHAAPGTAEFDYSEIHMQGRNCIERLNGVLKVRWRCLRDDRTLHYRPEKAGRILNACAGKTFDCYCPHDKKGEKIDLARVIKPRKKLMNV